MTSVSDLTYKSIRAIHLKEDEIVLVQREIERLERLDTTDTDLFGPTSKEIFAQRALQLRRLNDLQSAISVLPDDVLSTIFEIVCPPYQLPQGWWLDHSPWPLPPSSLRPALVLSSVSNHWRQVAISTSLLWRHLFVYTKREYCAESWAALFSLCVDRSPYSLEISVLLDDMYVASPTSVQIMPHPDFSDLLLDQFEWAVFVEFPQVITTLSLLGIDTERWSRFVGLLHPFTRMHEFRLEGMSQLGKVERQLSLPGFQSNLGSQLTTLDLRDLPYGLCVQFLRHCPNLVRCRCQGANLVHLDFNSQRWPDTFESVVFPRLEWLEWEASPTRESLQFGVTSAPALRVLRWNDSIYRHGEKQVAAGIDVGLTRFLSSAPALTELELTLFDEHLPSIPQIFDAIPGLEQLSLWGTYRQLLSAHSLLIKPLMASISKGIPLPKLHTLMLRVLISIRRGVEGNSVAADLLMIVRQRWMDRLISHFRLKLGFSEDWNTEVREGFRELVKEGLRLEILEMGGLPRKSQPVEWLHSTS